jgi:hypothetical protein
MPDAAPEARGVYKSRRPQASVGVRSSAALADRLRRALDARVRPMAPRRHAGRRQVARLRRAQRGFARIRCDACTHEYLLTFSCKCRDVCPSCHAKRLARWMHWLDTTLLAPVPHRQMVLAGERRAVEHERSRSRGRDGRFPGRCRERGGGSKAAPVRAASNLRSRPWCRPSTQDASEYASHNGRSA